MDALDVRSRLEVFVDDYLFESLSGVTLRLHSPTPREVALHLDRPWEGPISYDPVVMKDGDLYRMWYRAWRDEEQHSPRTCYAESKDGVNWRRPTLGLVEFQGSRENNIVIDGSQVGHVCVFRDGNLKAPSSERYKATGISPRTVDGKAAIVALVSPDGLHWEQMQEKAILVDHRHLGFDSHNIFFWDNVKERYAAYLRGWLQPSGVRSIRWCTSLDFRNWTEPEFIDMGDAPQEHLYKNACQPYFRAPHIYLMFPKRFLPERKAISQHPYEGVSDAVFMTSRDGHHWDRSFMEAFLRPGLDPNNWTERNTYIGPNVVPTSPTEISLYYMENYRHPTVRVRRATLRVDGFVSVNAPYAGGEFSTRPLRFEGGELAINYSTSAAGSIRAEIQDVEGSPIQGYGLADSEEMYGDEIEHVISWRGDTDLGSLADRPIRVRFVMRDADIYAMRFRPSHGG